MSPVNLATVLVWPTMSWPRSTQISLLVPPPFLERPAQRFSMRGHPMPRHIERLFTAPPRWRLENRPSGTTEFAFPATIDRIHCFHLQCGPTNFLLDTRTLEERKFLLHRSAPLPVAHVWLYEWPTTHTDLHTTTIILPFWQESLGTGLPKEFFAWLPTSSQAILPGLRLTYPCCCHHTPTVRNPYSTIPMTADPNTDSYSMLHIKFAHTSSHQHHPTQRTRIYCDPPNRTYFTPVWVLVATYSGTSDNTIKWVYLWVQWTFLDGHSFHHSEAFPCNLWCSALVAGFFTTASHNFFQRVVHWQFAACWGLIVVLACSFFPKCQYHIAITMDGIFQCVSTLQEDYLKYFAM